MDRLSSDMRGLPEACNYGGAHTTCDQNSLNTYNGQTLQCTEAKAPLAGAGNKWRCTTPNAPQVNSNMTNNLPQINKDWKEALLFLEKSPVSQLHGKTQLYSCHLDWSSSVAVRLGPMEGSPDSCAAGASHVL